MLRQGKVDAAAMPAAYRFQGTYEWLRGRPAAAQKWWQRSMKAAATLGARYELGMTYLEMGKRLGARADLLRAEAILTDIGARWDLAQVREFLKKAS